MHDITHAISHEGSPCIEKVIYWMDELTSVFDVLLYNDKVPPVIHNAVLGGYQKVQKYYGYTDDCVLYRAAIRMLSFASHLVLQKKKLIRFRFFVLAVLHPSLGAAWMRNAGWPEEWIDDAINAVQKHYNKHYRPKDSEIAPLSSQPSSSAGPVSNPAIIYSHHDELIRS